MSQTDHVAVLSAIHKQQTHNPLSILSLAEPILASEQQQQNNTRSSTSAEDVSNRDSTLQDAHLTPTALSADLEHYKSLFSKLRFSYLEQVTKEKYLRSIVGDPPVLFSHEDNLALEEKLVGMKSELKAKKENVNKLVEEIEQLARKVATEQEALNKNVAEVERLPKEIAQLKDQVAEVGQKLKEKEDEMDVDVSDDPRMNLTLKETESLLEEQRQRNKDIDAQIEALQRDMPGKTRECERAERELEELESKKNEVTRLARELRRIREEGGRDMLEEQGRWYKSSEIVLKELLELES